jgi:hypothetical protein
MGSDTKGTMCFSVFTVFLYKLDNVNRRIWVTNHESLSKNHQ